MSEIREEQPPTSLNPEITNLYNFHGAAQVWFVFHRLEHFSMRKFVSSTDDLLSATMSILQQHEEA